MARKQRKIYIIFQVLGKIGTAKVIYPSWHSQP